MEPALAGHVLSYRNNLERSLDRAPDKSMDKCHIKIDRTDTSRAEEALLGVLGVCFLISRRDRTWESIQQQLHND